MLTPLSPLTAGPRKMKLRAAFIFTEQLTRARIKGALSREKHFRKLSQPRVTPLNSSDTKVKAMSSVR
jgi:hypothetical protein